MIRRSPKDGAFQDRTARPTGSRLRLRTDRPLVAIRMTLFASVLSDTSGGADGSDRLTPRATPAIC
jgi:hypothetical protein